MRKLKIMLAAGISSATLAVAASPAFAALQCCYYCYWFYLPGWGWYCVYWW